MAVSYTQDTRRLGVTTVLGKDAMLLSRFSGTESMSGLFSYELQLLSEDDQISAQSLVGQPLVFWVLHPDNEPRYYSGYVRQFEYIGQSDRLSLYRATVVPWLWFTSLNSDCRIFQEMTAPEIIRKVFKDRGFTDFEDDFVRASYPTLEYCVQYNESDFAFVSRLMEECGISYFFRHEDSRHVLVMTDTASACKDCKDATVSFQDNLSERSYGDSIWEWRHQYEYRAGKWAYRDYDFKSPTDKLAADSSTVLNLPNNKAFEVYQYPGRYTVNDDGHLFTKVRIEAEESRYDTVNGAGSCRSFSPGAKFKMDKHHSSRETGKSYIVTSVRHFMDGSNQYTTGGGQASEGYENDFTCIPAEAPLRPMQESPRPRVQGPQTAVVVGPAGEEIYTDEHGRVKVQFHWDREGQKNENSSCWMRVSQVHAGQGWGMMDLPRIGEEVIVSFLEGDPDRPIITGRVYNGQNTPPFALPAGKTRRGNMTKTYKGAGFNEMSMDDTPGKEQLRMNAQYDMNSNVNNDQTLDVGNNQTEKVAVDRSRKVGSNESVAIGADQKIEVAGSQMTVVGANQCVQVGVDQSVVAGNKIVINAGTSIELKCGASRLKMDKGGFITLTGTVLTIAGAAQASLSAPVTNVTGAVLLTNMGAVIEVAGGLTQVRGKKVDVVGGTTVIKGAPITLN